MSTEELDNIVRRRLVIVSLDGYEDGQEGFQEAIAAQVERVTGWLADPGLGDDRRFEVVRAAPAPRTVEQLRAFLHDQKLAAAHYNEAVVVYLTGHGLRGYAQRHYLMLPKSKQKRLLATAYPTSELITAVMDSQSEHVLVLVDSCHSGMLHAELTGLFLDLSPERHNHKGMAVITAGDHYEKPLVGSFTRRIALACERLRDEAAGYTASHLSFAQWEQLLHQVTADPDSGDKDLVSAEWIVPQSRSHAPSACLPNPRYRPVESTTGPALRQLALGCGPLEEFWLERASGRTGADDSGWYFSGRAGPMARMVSFVQEGRGVLVVTGAAGSGKSALLARLVTMADPGFTTDPQYAAVVAGIPDGLRPEPGAVDVAVLARNKSARVVVEELLSALGGAPGEYGLPLRALLGLLAGRAGQAARPVTVVIDALDEAEDPLACVGDIVLPLARLTAGDDPAVRLVVGVRSSPAPAAASGRDLRDERADDLLRKLTSALGAEGGSVVPVLRTDGPDCAEDIAAYTAALLCAPRDSPYYGAPEAAFAAARQVAEAVTPSFLDARIAADQLRTARVRQDLDEAGWLRRLADGTTGLLREDVMAVAAASGVPSGLLAAALRATALAPGAGLPWAEVWPAVTAALASHADAVAGHVDTATADRAIRTLRDSRLTGYLATTEEDERAVYRPVHQRLTDLLLAGADWLSGTHSSASVVRHPPGAPALQEAHAVVTRALAALVRRASPHLAHPYIRRHFLNHASAAGLLTDREVPVELLAQETSGTLRARLALPLPAGDHERRALTAAALIEPYLGEDTDYASRLGSIAFHRRMRGRSAPEPQLPGLPLTPSWGRWAARVNVLAPAPGRTAALSVVPALDGRQLIAVAAAAGGVRVWDAASGRRVADLDTGPVHRLRTILATGGRTFLVALGHREVRIYDPVSGQLIAQTPLPPTHDVHVMADGPALWKLCVLTRRGAYLWRPRANRLHEVPGFPATAQDSGRQTGPSGPLTAVVRPGGGHAAVAVRDADGIRLWDLASGPLPGPAFGGPQVSGLVSVPRPDREDDLLIAESPNPLLPLQVWNPFTRQEVTRASEGGATAVAGPGGTAFAYVARGRIVLQSIGAGPVRSFDADIPSVDALAVLEDPAGPRVVSAGQQGIRIWDPGFSGPQYGNGLAESVYPGPALDRHRRSAPTWPVCRALLPRTGDSPGVEAVVLATRGGLDVHDGKAGALVKRISAGLVSGLLPLVPASSRVAVSDPNGHLSVWDLVSGQMVVTSRGESAQAGSSSCVAWTAEGLPVAVFTGAAGRRGELTSVVLDHEAGHATARTAPLSGGTAGSGVRLLGGVPLSSSGEITVVAIADGELTLLDAASGRRTGTLPGWDPGQGEGSMVCGLVTDDGVLLAVSDGSDIGVWDVATSTRAATWEAADTFAMAALPLPGGAPLLVSGSASGVRLWDPRTGGLVHTLLTGAPVHGIALGRGTSGPLLHLYGPAGLATVSVSPSLL
ncbi:AAA family ATPase [Streptomyces avermitilis]|uniref:AAA family ATPase n=1 Tax=Streptomyces avermitilis TaxID=33903 RepID=UPI0036972A49